MTITRNEAIRISLGIVGLGLIIGLIIQRGESVAPAQTNLPPLYWGDIAPKLVAAGVIDIAKL